MSRHAISTVAILALEPRAHLLKAVAFLLLKRVSIADLFFAFGGVGLELLKSAFLS
jgi:hypothetical protein